MSQYFEILTPPSGVTIPLVVHVPHGSREIPGNFRPQFALTDDELRNEILAMTDAYTDELFRATIELGGLMFVNRTSRLVMDPERFPDDDEEPMSAKGMGGVSRAVGKCTGGAEQNYTTERHSLSVKISWSV